MQNRKNNKENRTGREKRKESIRKDIIIEDFLMEEDGGFDEEDEDNVTDDTLEFLCLDDLMTDSRHQKHKGTASDKKAISGRYSEDEYEEDEYEDDEDEDEYGDDEYEEDDEYEDDEEEYDEYEDDEYAYEYDEYDDEDGIFARLKYSLTHMSTLDMMVAMLGIVVLAGAFLAGGLYMNAKSVAKQVDAFATVGEELEGISVIGESGLLAVSESARLSGMIGLEEEVPEEEEEKPEEDAKGTIEVMLNLTSIQSDLKIKFVNKATGKLIGSVPFEVEVSGGKKSFDLKDEDKDGIIYQTGVGAGDYSVKIKPFTDDRYADYKLPSSASSVKVTDTITYKKVDVADEVKTEAEVNAAAEDTAVQNTVVESVLTDTVEWVESTKTPVGDEKAAYTEVDKKNIPDPWTVSSAYRKLVEGGERTSTGTSSGTSTDPSTGGDQTSPDTPTDPSTGGDQPTPEPPTSPEQPTEPPAEWTVTLSSGSLTLKKGESATLTVSCSGSSKTPNFVWTSSASNIASVNGSGSSANVSALSEGEATITVEAEIDGVTKTASCSVKVEKAEEPPAELKASLSSTSLNLKKGGTASLTVQVSSGKIQSIDWASSNTSVATVSGGNVTAVGTGSAVITARVKGTNGNQDLTCNVTVQDAYTKITISGTAEVAVGKTVTLTAQTEPKDGRVTWSSGNTAVATVSDKGVVTGVAEGTVEIKAACTDATNVSASYKITVKKTTVDGSAKLKDKDGNQMYYLDASGTYKEATYDDYRKYDKFYKKTSEPSAYKYTGWQTIDGSVYFYDKNGNYVTGEQVIQGAKYSFGSDGKLSSNSGSMGIDVSKWNGSIDWNAVKNSGVSYVIIRCGYRGSSTGALIEDPKFRSNIKGAKAAGLKVGVYFFSQAVNEVEAVEEASMTLGLVNGYGLNYPIFLDVEASGGRGDGVSRDVRTAVCKAFCATIQNSGYSAGIYANKTWFSEKINTGSLTGYKIWLAQYASVPTYTATRYDMWQYSSKGKVSGISGNVDMNISYMHY